jgi:RND superfamily putative drug exporter
MPLLLGAFSVTVATGLIAVIGSLFDVSIFALNVASMIGLGLGIDFSLILITRFRQEMAAGFEPGEAMARTMSTAGRSITFSAVTVMLSMLVMTLFMHDFMILRSISMGVALVAFTSLLVALTLLPAVLGVLGHRIEWLRVVPSRRAEKQAQRGAWYRLSHAIMRRPWVWLVPSLVFLGLLALPVRQIKTGVKTTGDLPATAESVAGAQALGQAFGPGRLTPIQIVMQTGPGGLWTPQLLKAVQQLTDTAAADPRTQSVQSLSTVAQSAGISAARFTSLSSKLVKSNASLARKAGQFVNLNGDNDVALITIVPRTEEFAASHQALVHDIRDKIVPAMPQLNAYNVSVGGEAANSIDFTETVYGRFPLIVAMVLLMTFVILLMFFQSVTLPLKAMFMNLATMLATYGALVVLFQYGWGSGLFGFPSQGLLDLVTPVILYAILFALSTDYEVFMLSRVREFYQQMHNNAEAVAAGLQSVGGMISAAGLILIATFGAFATARIITLKELGLGLAIGVLLDSTVVRIVMVPATMRLMGDWNWWMPTWLKAVVPELREGPALITAPAAASVSAAPRPDALPVAAAQSPGHRAVSAEQTLLFSRPVIPLAEGHLRPMGDSIGTDAIVLPRATPMRIGRHDANELKLFDPMISRFHARIDCVDGQFFITDLGSTNGTYVNLRQMPAYDRTLLQTDDLIRIGNSDRLTFEFQMTPPERLSQPAQQGVRDIRQNPHGN